LGKSGERAPGARGEGSELCQIVTVWASEESKQEQVERGAMGLGKLEVVVQYGLDASHGEPLFGGVSQPNPNKVSHFL